jgi:hypothetical protein
LPVNMQGFDRSEYIDTHKRIIDIEVSGMNVDMLESLRNYAFKLITPYITGLN